GEGLCEPITAHAVGFIPFALDRQIVADARPSEGEGGARVVSADRGALTIESTRFHRTHLTLTSRLHEPSVVYVRHAVAIGFDLKQGPEQRERAGGAYLFKVSVPANGKVDIDIEETSNSTKTTDVRSPEGLAMARATLASAAPGAFRDKLAAVVKLADD